MKSVRWRTFEKPKRIKIDPENASETYGRFIAEPFERGYGVTIGNTLRRILLSSLTGAAVTAVKFEGVAHEYSTIEGVVEDVPNIILNLKGLLIKMYSTGPETITLKVSKSGPVLAKDIKHNQNVEILNKDHHIATLAEGSELDIEMTINSGRGYVPAEMNKKDSHPLGVITIDADYSPIRKVRYDVEETRVGQITNYDRLVLEVWTDGTVSPQESISCSARILRDYLSVFSEFDEMAEEEEEPVIEVKEEKNELLDKQVSELELSVRAANCLKAANIHSLRELVEKTEVEMLKYRNFGRKSLNEIKALVEDMGLSFGMKLDETGQATGTTEDNNEVVGEI